MSYELRFWLGGVLKTGPVFKQKMQSGKEIGSHKTDGYAFTEFVGIFKDKRDNMCEMALSFSQQRRYIHLLYYCCL